MLNGFATPSRIFGLAFKQKKWWKKYGIFYKFASKLKRCSKLPTFMVLNTRFSDHRPDTVIEFAYVFHRDGMYARNRPLPLCVYSVACHHRFYWRKLLFLLGIQCTFILLFLREPWHVLWQIGTMEEKERRRTTL